MKIDAPKIVALALALIWWTVAGFACAVHVSPYVWGLNVVEGFAFLAVTWGASWIRWRRWRREDEERSRR